MTLYTVDFETYYADDFGFSCMTTEEYVRDDRFEVIGVAVQVDGGDTTWFSGTHAEIKQFLQQFNLPNGIVLAHNTMFDAAILNWHFDIRPARLLDTLSMARATVGATVGGSLAALAKEFSVGEKGDEVVRAKGKRRLDFTPEELAAYGQYCVNDVELTTRLYGALRFHFRFPDAELMLIDRTLRMFTEPCLYLNAQVLAVHQAALQEKQERLLAAVQAEPETLRSNDKFAAALVQLGVEPPRKVSKTTGKETWAFAKSDQEFTDLLEHPNPTVQALVSARLGVKSTIEQSRTERFLQIAQRGPLPIALMYYGAHTGRWSGADKINLQNLPKGSALRDAIIAPKGYVLVDCDSSQIEARVLAWIAQQDDLVAAFRDGSPVYEMMASRIYNKPISEIDEKSRERFVGKQTVLGAGYGMGPERFQAQLAGFGVLMPLEECRYAINQYRNASPMITQFWDVASRAISAMMSDRTVALGRPGVLLVEGKKGIKLPNGMYLRYPNLRQQRNGGQVEYVYDQRRGRATTAVRIYGGKLVENICQALARIIIGEQLLLISHRYPVPLTVHDAVAALVPESEADAGKEYVVTCMRHVPDWATGLPLNCKVGVGRSYGEC